MLNMENTKPQKRYGVGDIILDKSTNETFLIEQMTEDEDGSSICHLLCLNDGKRTLETIIIHIDEEWDYFKKLA